jgi:uncharacterized protein YqgC (DUF456 family)
MVVGIVGTVLPILPGLWLVWIAALVYGLVAGFGSAGIAAMAVITALLIGGTAASVYVPQRGAAGAGVPWWGQLVALAAAIAGFFLIPVIGALLGFAVGILVVALLRTRDVGAAWAATKATLLGMLKASGLQLTAGVLMALVWVAWVVWG